MEGFTRLSLWYVYKVHREEEIEFQDVVNRRVNIYRNTSFYGGKRHSAHEDADPEWAEVLDRPKEVYDRYSDDPSTVAFEAEGLPLLWPYLEARLRGRVGGEVVRRLRGLTSAGLTITAGRTG